MKKDDEAYEEYLRQQHSLMDNYDYEPKPQEYLYHIGLGIRNLTFTHGISLVLYYNNVDQRFKYCYCDHCPGDHFDHDLVLIKRIKNTKAEDYIPLRKKSILRTEAELIDNGIQIVHKVDCYSRDYALLYNGKARIALDEEDLKLLLIHALRSLAEKDEELLSRSQSFLGKDSLLLEIREIEKKVREYKIDEVLNGLHIYVREHCSCRVGRDDFYKTVTVDIPEDTLDNYLKDYIGLGERCIYEARGYTSAYVMRIKGLITGDYNEEQVAVEKEKLIASYSVQEHIYYNICEYVSEHMNPKGLSHAKLSLSLERNSLLPLFWRICSWRKNSKMLDDLDRRCSPNSFTEESLKTINDELAIFSEHTKDYN